MGECLIFLYYNGEIKESEEGAVFRGSNYVSFYVEENINFEDLKNIIESHITGEGEVSIRSIAYRFPISLIEGKVQYRAYEVRNDNDVKMLFDSYKRYYPSISAAEVLVDLESEQSLSHRDASQIGEYGDSSDESDPDFVFSEEEAEHSGDETDETLPPVVPPEFMYLLDCGAMNVPELSGTQSVVPSSFTGELTVGMQFYCKEDVQDVIKKYNIRKFVEHKVVKSNPTTYYVQCKFFGEVCNWRCLARFLQKKQLWEITRYNGPHACTLEGSAQDHQNLDSNIICREILSLVEKNPSVDIRMLQGIIRMRFGHEPSYRKTWIGRQKAVERVFGNWENSFHELSQWLKAMVNYIPGSVFRLQTDNAFDENGLIDPTKRVFRRLFWSFGPMIEAFPHCKRLVQIDGCHLYGKYKGTLLIAVSQDGNRHIVPLAFAIVEGETEGAWTFFLHNLRELVTPQDGVVFISDRHRSIKAVFRKGGDSWQPPRAYHVYCIRHIAANFLREFNNNHVIEKLVLKIGYAKTVREFTHYYHQLQSVNPTAARALDNIGREKWSQLYGGGLRYGHMTTNLSESMNSLLKKTRNLPIKALVEATYHRFGKLWSIQGRNAMVRMAEGERIVTEVAVELEANRDAMRNIQIHDLDRDANTFQAEELIGSYQGTGVMRFRVNLVNRWCDCGEFQVKRYPCRHAIAGCLRLHREWQVYIDDVFRWQTVLNVYSRKFEVMPNEAYWPDYNGETVIPNPNMQRIPVGRPMSTRIRNEMDLREPSQRKRCPICHNIGHSRKKCPSQPGSSRN